MAKELPESLTAPGYPADRIFLTLDGSVYTRFNKVDQTDKYTKTSEVWDKIEMGLDTECLADNETMIFDPERTMFVFLRQRAN